MAFVTIDLKLLKRIIDELLDKVIEESRTGKIVVDESRDFFFEVPYKAFFNVEKPAPQLDIGRLTDDWQFLQPQIADPSRSVRPMLMHVVPILRYMAEEENLPEPSC